MNWLSPVLAVAILLVCQSSRNVSAKCSHYQINVCNEDLSSCHCFSCKNCTAGYGQEPQCGGQVIMEFPKCIKCKQGTTYSQEYSMESCKPCTICHGTKTLKACTVFQPTKCSNECQDGYVLNPAIKMCEQVYQPAQKEAKHKRFEDDLEYSTPTSNQSVSETNKTHTSIKKKSTYIKTDSNILYMVSIIISGLIVGTAVVFCIYKKRSSIISRLHTFISSDFGNREEDIPLHALIPDDVLLKNISPSLREKIAIKISRKGWKDIGHEYNFDRDSMDKIDFYSMHPDNPGELLLKKLDAEKPEETLKQFLTVLCKLKRRDVIEMIHQEYAQPK